jgi:hypothetical protein
VLAGLAGGLGYYFSTQRGDYERLISAADAAAAGKDVHLACTRYDALFERAKSEQVPRSVLPSLDAAMQRWRDLVTAEVNDADGRARAGDLPAAAQRYLAVQKLSSAGVVPESSTDQVAAALSRHRRLYLDLIDAAATRQRDGDFVAASEKYRQLHGLSRSADLPMAVDADVRDALERRWPELYRRQITEARQLRSGGDKPGACKLFAALLGERGQEVPSAVAEELKSALAQAVQTCGDKPR